MGDKIRSPDADVFQKLAEPKRIIADGKWGCYGRASAKAGKIKRDDFVPPRKIFYLIVETLFARHISVQKHHGKAAALSYQRDIVSVLKNSKLLCHHETVGTVRVIARARIDAVKAVFEIHAKGGRIRNAHFQKDL